MVELEYVIYKKRMRKLGLFSLERDLRVEQILSSTIMEGPELHFPSMHSKRMRIYSHKVQEGKFQLDITKKKLHSESGWALEQASQRALEKALSNLI